jgi:hypothetical protein
MTFYTFEKRTLDTEYFGLSKEILINLHTFSKEFIIKVPLILERAPDKCSSIFGKSS